MAWQIEPYVASAENADGGGNGFKGSSNPSSLNTIVVGRRCRARAQSIVALGRIRLAAAALDSRRKEGGTLQKEVAERGKVF